MPLTRRRFVQQVAGGLPVGALGAERDLPGAAVTTGRGGARCQIWRSGEGALRRRDREGRRATPARTTLIAATIPETEGTPWVPLMNARRADLAGVERVPQMPTYCTSTGPVRAATNCIWGS